MVGKELSAESLLKNFSKELALSKLWNSSVTTSNLSDALRHVAGENGVLTGVKPVKEGLRIMGKATTVETASDDWGTVIQGIYAAKRGDVLVIKCSADDPAVWGEMASSTAQKRGVVGTVIHGSARDISGIKSLNYPVFSRDVIPNAGDAKAEGRLNVPVECGKTTVNPGDFIMGDECGVVCVPQGILEDVFREAFSIVDNEDEIVAKIKKGSSFLEILGIDK